MSGLLEILGSHEDAAARLCREGVLRSAVEKIASGAVDILSLDVWDTLLFRQVHEPVDVFLLQRDLLVEGGLINATTSAYEWQFLRVGAERRIRGKRGREVTIDEIYAEIERLELPRLTKSDAIETEIQAECAVALVDPVAAALLNEARENGVATVLVSDFYMSAPVLKRIIDCAAFRSGVELAPLRELFVSCDHASFKAQHLFDKVQRKLAVPFARILHVGDSEQADIVPSSARSMHACHYAQASEWHREAESKERALLPSHGHARARDFGAGSLRRIVSKNLGAMGSAEAAVGAFAFGPLLFGFVSWILDRLEREGVGDVYFLTRESHVLLPYAEALSRRRGQELRCHVLPMSRRFARLLAIRDGRRYEIARLFDADLSYSLEDFVGVLGIDKGDVPTDLEKSHFPDPQTRIVGTDQGVFLDKLLSSRTVLHKVRRYIAAQKRSFRAYVDERTPLAETARLHIVDLGWGGTIQRKLARFLRNEGLQTDLQGLYMGTADAVQLDTEPRSYYSSYLFEFGLPANMFEPIRRSVCVYETATMPPHGSLLEFDGSKPLFETSWLPPDDYERISRMQEGHALFFTFALSFLGSRNAGTQSHHCNDITITADMGRAIAVRQNLFPSAFETETIGKLPFEENLAHRRTRAMTEFGRSDKFDMSIVPAVNFSGYSQDEVFWVSGFLNRHFRGISNFYGAFSLGLLDAEDLDHLTANPVRTDGLAAAIASSKMAEKAGRREQASLEHIIKSLMSHFDVGTVVELGAADTNPAAQFANLLDETVSSGVLNNNADVTNTSLLTANLASVDAVELGRLIEALQDQAHKASVLLLTYTSSSSLDEVESRLEDDAARPEGTGFHLHLEGDYRALTLPHPPGTMVYAHKSNIRVLRKAVRQLEDESSMLRLHLELDRREFEAEARQLQIAVAHLQLELEKQRGATAENRQLKAELTALSQKYTDELKFYGTASKYFNRAYGFARYVPGGRRAIRKIRSLIFYIAEKLERFE